MHSVGRQRGLTMWGISMMILIGVFFLFLFFKLFPPYMEDAQVSSALKAFATSPDARDMAPAEAREAIEKRFDVDTIRNVNVNRDVKFVPEGGGYAVQVDYEVLIEMFGNVSVLLEFDHQYSVR